jgi:1,2-diacylglycerol 3-alpha-glucosyltransferase
MDTLQTGSLRIGLFNDNFLPIIDGVGRVVYSYATELIKLGHQVSVVAAMDDTGHRGNYPFELIDYISHRVPTSPQYRTGTPVNDVHYRKRIAMIPLDIVHAHGPFGAGREALRLANRRNIPLIASFHSKYYDDFFKATKSEALARLVVANIIAFYEKCDDVWAVSETTAKVLRSYGYKGILHVMPNGVSPRQPDPAAIRKLEEEYRIGDMPLLLFAGQINWKKNLLRVLEASALLKNRGQVFRLILAGMGPDMEEVRKKILELGLSDCTVITGHIADPVVLDAMYARACLFVFPSLYDNAPMVVREAAVLGTPSVLIAGSDAAEIITDKQNGFLCRDNAEDLCTVLKGALDDLEGAKRVGLAAQASIPIPWPRIMAQVMKGYERNLQNFAGRKPSRRLSNSIDE